MKLLTKLTLSLVVLVLSLVQTAQASPFKTEEWQTKKGARVVFHQAKEVPMLDINIAFAAGSAYDGKQFGLSSLTADLLDQGNAGMDASVIAERFAETGAQMGNNTSRDMAIFSLKSLTQKENLQKALDTFSAVISKPDFPNDSFVREKNQQLMAITQAQESPEEVANLVLFKRLYGTHPYAHPIKGIAKSVRALKREDVLRFYQQYYVARNAVIVLVGDISTQKAHQIAEQLTANLAEGKEAPRLSKASQLNAEEKIAIDFPSSQTVLRLAQIGIDHHDSDYFPLLVGNYILGGGALVSLLSHEVREKRGLTYGVSSQFIPMPGDGPFIVSLSTQSKNATTALQLTSDTLNQFVQKGPTDEELRAAKQYLMGSFPLSFGSNENIGNMLVRMTFYHLPKNYLDNYVASIKKVTTEEIRNAFQKKLQPKKMLVIAVGKV